MSLPEYLGAIAAFFLAVVVVCGELGDVRNAAGDKSIGNHATMLFAFALVLAFVATLLALLGVD